jgi:hypothetical protein
MTYAGRIEITDTLTPAIQQAAAAFKQLGETLRSPTVRYPLHCVSRDDAAATEDQYLGPFDSHDTAHEQLRDRSDVVRRCRQLRPSEVAVDHVELIGLSLSELIDVIDECATNGNLPDAAWFLIASQIVFGDGNDGSLPTAENYVEWVDTHLRIDAYVCEGDE